MTAPERIGRYVVTGELGRGAMGTVYRARDFDLDREVAVKVMSHGLVDADARGRFLREARSAARLSHPNIVVVYELGEHEGAPFMALELLEGVDLQQAIAAGIRPDPRATLPVVLQILAGLGHAHEHGIVHRDVKPSNVFLPAGRPAKITDFGVARLSGVGTTTSGAVVGTPNYMSPEQVAAADIDGRSDLFSVGLILYELVTGERAIRADTVVAALYKILHETPDLSILPAGGGWSELRSVLERALAHRREDRYPDARTMSDELARALVALGGTVDWTAAADQMLVSRQRLGRPASRPGQLASREGPVAAASPPRPSPPSARAGRGAPPAGGRRLALAAGAGAALVLAVGAAGWLALSLGPWGRRPMPAVAPAALSRNTAAAAEPSPTSRASNPSLPAASQRRGAPTSAPADASLPTAAVGSATSPAALATSPAALTVPATPPAAAATPPTAVAGLGPEQRLARARELVGRERWSEALAEARQVLEAVPSSREASQLAQQAEAELVIEDCLRKARAALREGDRDTALEEVRRGFLVRKNDERLLALHREALQQ